MEAYEGLSSGPENDDVNPHVDGDEEKGAGI